MTSHSDYHIYGFNADEIFHFLAKNGIDLAGEAVPTKVATKWPAEYSLFPAFGKHDAALIMSDIVPEGFSDFHYWDDPHEEVARKLKLIDAYAANIIALDPDFEFNRSTGKRSWSSTEIDSHEKIGQSIWREWCANMGLTWPIPERSNNRLTEPSTDAELLAKWQKAERDLADANEQIELMKGQLSEAQKAIDGLRRTAGNKEAIAPHNTHLMKIAIEVQRDHWNDLSTPPKQEILIAELREKYGLTKPEAQAVERVACPIDRKK